MLEAAVRSGTPPPKNEPDSDELLTAEQVAQILKVKAETVRSWIQSGALRASRPGNGTRLGRKYRVRDRTWTHLSRHPSAGPCRRRSSQPPNGRDFGRAGLPDALIRRL